MASGVGLPSLASNPQRNVVSGQLDLRISQEGKASAVVDQWRITAAVKDYQFTNSLKLDGSIDLAYEKSGATNFKSRYTLAADVKI